MAVSKKTQKIINNVESIQDYVGKELTSPEEVEQAIETIIATEEAKQPAQKTIQAKTNGVLRKPAHAPKKTKSVVLDGNQEVVTDKKTKAVLLQAEKKAAKKPAAEKKQKQAKKPAEEKQVVLLEKGVKTPVSGSRVVTVGGVRKSIHGYDIVTAEKCWEIVQFGEQARAEGRKVTVEEKKALAEKLNIALPNVGDVLNGQPWAVKMLAKKGYTHPHPRDENGPRIGKKHFKDQESETIDGVAYHKESK